MVGNAIYTYVEELGGEERAPKITGMILDLTQEEMLTSVQTMESLIQYVNTAVKMLEELDAQEQAEGQKEPIPTTTTTGQV